MLFKALNLITDKKNSKFLKKFKKTLAFCKMIVYNSFCCHDNGLSPSGKALDSDSSISGVRIPQAQLTLAIKRGIFFAQILKR